MILACSFEGINQLFTAIMALAGVSIFYFLSVNELLTCKENRSQKEVLLTNTFIINLAVVFMIYFTHPLSLFCLIPVLISIRSIKLAIDNAHQSC